jgi:transposase-like protein
MPAPIPAPVRRALFQRSRKGATVATVAEEFELSERTVRHLVRRFDERGSSGWPPTTSASGADARTGEATSGLGRSCGCKSRINTPRRSEPAAKPNVGINGKTRCRVTNSGRRGFA